MPPGDVAASPAAPDLHWLGPDWQQPVLRRLRALGDIPPGELSMISAAIGGRTRHAAGDEAPTERDKPRFVLKGWAAAQRLLPDGRRQILRLLLPGDLIGAPAGVGARGLPVVALTALETASAALVVETAVKRPDSALRRALTRSAWRDEQILLDQVMRTGRLSGPERLADLLVELRDRLQLVGLGDARSFPLPITQEALADMLGLSVVHVCRLKTRLQTSGMLRWRAGAVTLFDSDRLAALACRDAA